MWPLSKKDQSEPNWDGSWSVLQGDHEGAPLIVRIHQEVGRLVHDGSFPYQVGIAVPLQSPNEHGLPEPDEMEILSALEDKIVQTLERDRECIHVATITTSGMREFVLYTSAPETVEATFQELKDAAPTHEVQLMIQPDEDWSVYEQFAS